MERPKFKKNDKIYLDLGEGIMRYRVLDVLVGKHEYRIKPMLRNVNPYTIWPEKHDIGEVHSAFKRAKMHLLLYE